MKTTPISDERREKISALISDIRKGRVTRFGGGSTVYDFFLDRESAIDRVLEFLKDAK